MQTACRLKTNNPPKTIAPICRLILQPLIPTEKWYQRFMSCTLKKEGSEEVMVELRVESEEVKTKLGRSFLNAKGDMRTNLSIAF
jgi:hypothetical protein